jgi:hypothetical protein
LLQYMLRGEVDPWMFHQANLRAYDGVHTLLGDLLDRTLAKYSALFVLPVRSLTHIALGQAMQARMDYNAAGVRASIAPAERTITITASGSAVVPVTGLCSESSEVYGAQCVSHIALAPGQTVTYSIDQQRAGGSPTDASPASVREAGVVAIGPNPGRGRISLATPAVPAATAHLSVFDLRGRRVAVLQGPAGSPLVWEGRDETGTRVGSGVYFYRLDVAGIHRQGKVVVMH